MIWEVWFIFVLLVVVFIILVVSEIVFYIIMMGVFILFSVMGVLIFQQVLDGFSNFGFMIVVAMFIIVVGM